MTKNKARSLRDWPKSTFAKIGRSITNYDHEHDYHTGQTIKGNFLPAPCDMEREVGSDKPLEDAPMFCTYQLNRGTNH